MNTTNRLKILIPIILFLFLLGGGAYWYFGAQTVTTTPETASGNPFNIFRPLGNAPTGSNGTPTGTPNEPVIDPSATSTPSVAPIPALRLLSSFPVGGYGASTTADTTVVRWIDRGRGDVFETSGLTLNVTTISNTLVPRMYRSLWDKNLTALVGSVLDSSGMEVDTLYAQLYRRPISNSTTTPAADAASRTTYELRGRSLPDNIITFAVSPKKDRLFMLVNESGRGVGYTSTFDGRTVTRIFDTPLTEVTSDWPEENTIVITTKASASQSGFLYFVNPKTGIWKKILGPQLGLTAKVSRDAKHILLSFTGSGGTIVTNLYNVTTGAATDAVIRTLADKCVWGNFYKHLIYCAVPTQRDTATYPDAWYRGTVSFIDSLWQINVTTGEVNMLASLLETADRLIDAYTLDIDGRDDYLFFINKNDLSLWSLDLVAGN